VCAHDVAVEDLDSLAGALQVRDERFRERRLACAREAGEPKNRTTLSLP
jgi:hypothetical protein